MILVLLALIVLTSGNRDSFVEGSVIKILSLNHPDEVRSFLFANWLAQSFKLNKEYNNKKILKI